MNKKEKTELCRNILKNGDGYILPMDEYVFMMDIFDNHPEFIDKYGCGIDYIYVKRTAYGTNCFYFKRTDGTETDISYLACLKKRKLIDNVRIACRNAIRPIIKSKLDNISFGIDVCPVTGKLLERGNVDVHHDDMYNFRWIFGMWYNVMIDDFDIDFSTKLNSVSDGDVFTIFIDDDIKESFLSAHNHYAKLLVVSKKGHRILHTNHKY